MVSCGKDNQDAGKLEFYVSGLKTGDEAVSRLERTFEINSIITLEVNGQNVDFNLTNSQTLSSVNPFTGNIDENTKIKAVLPSDYKFVTDQSSYSRFVSADRLELLSYSKADGQSKRGLLNFGHSLSLVSFRIISEDEQFSFVTTSLKTFSYKYPANRGDLVEVNPFKSSHEYLALTAPGDYSSKQIAELEYAGRKYPVTLSDAILEADRVYSIIVRIAASGEVKTEIERKQSWSILLMSAEPAVDSGFFYLSYNGEKIGKQAKWSINTNTGAVFKGNVLNCTTSMPAGDYTVKAEYEGSTFTSQFHVRKSADRFKPYIYQLTALNNRHMDYNYSSEGILGNLHLFSFKIPLSYFEYANGSSLRIQIATPLHALLYNKFGNMDYNTFNLPKVENGSFYPLSDGPSNYIYMICTTGIFPSGKEGADILPYIPVATTFNGSNENLAYYPCKSNIEVGRNMTLGEVYLFDKVASSTNRDKLRSAGLVLCDGSYMQVILSCPSICI